MNAQEKNIVLNVQDLSVSYGGQLAVQLLDFQVRQGEFVSIVGPSGCGKSTMLNVLSGLLAPTRGKVFVEGKQLYQKNDWTPRLGYVFQGHRLLPWRTVRQNLELAMSAAGIPSAEWEQDIRRILKTLEISQFVDAWPMRLSGGQRQRVSIARALLVRPAYILMDEPFSTLDEVTARSMRQEISALCARTGVTVVFVTHSLREAVYLADRIIVLSRGPARVLSDFSVPIERPRAYDDVRVGQTELQLVEHVNEAWGLEASTEKGA